MVYSPWSTARPFSEATISRNSADEVLMSRDGTLPPVQARTFRPFMGRYWLPYTTHCLQSASGKSLCNSADTNVTAMSMPLFFCYRLT